MKNFRAYRSENRCDHVLRVSGNANAYEMGLRLSPDGSHYILVWDNFQGGYGLCAKVGNDAGLLLQAYGIENAIREAELQGMSVAKETDAEGNVYLVCVEN